MSAPSSSGLLVGRGFFTLYPTLVFSMFCITLFCDRTFLPGKGKVPQHVKEKFVNINFRLDVCGN